MRVMQPEHMSQTFADAFNARDLERLLSLYEPDAVYAALAQPVRGLAAIRAVFTRLLVPRSKIEITNEYCLVFDDVAPAPADGTLPTLPKQRSNPDGSEQSSKRSFAALGAGAHDKRTRASDLAFDDLPVLLPGLGRTPFAGHALDRTRQSGR